MLRLLVLAIVAILYFHSSHGVSLATCPSRFTIHNHTGVRGIAYQRLKDVTTADGCCAKCAGDSACSAWILQSKSEGGVPECLLKKGKCVKCHA